MRNINEMLAVLEQFDYEDYDVIEKLVPLVYSESLEEYNKSFNYFDVDKADLRFIISDRIYWFLIDNSGWGDVDLDFIVSEVDEYFGK